MPQALLKELDEAARGQHKRRSELLKDLVLQYLRGETRYFRERDPFERIREFQLELEPGETAEGLIRRERESH